MLIFVPLFPPAFKGGGPIRSLEAMVTTSTASDSIYVVTSSTDLGSNVPLPVKAFDTWTSWKHARVRYTSARALKYFGALFAAGSTRPQVVYVNGIFDWRFSIVPTLFRSIIFWRSGAMFIVAPRGELHPGALAIKASKKAAFLTAAKRSGLFKSVVWHASSTLEARDIRAVFGPSSAIIVKENETLLPPHALDVGSVNTQPRATFIGRISRKKGLHVLLEAIEGLELTIDIDIFGTIEDREYFDDCLAHANLAPSVRVRYMGEVPPTRVRRTFNRYDAFLFPTRGENFGHVIAEALSASCPVFLEDVTPWTQMIQSGGGVLIQGSSVQAWRQAVQDLAERSPSDRLEMRRRSGMVYESWQERRIRRNFIDDVLLEPIADLLLELEA
jgi:glycosyltransferase involved in cell wall biosynthesis